MFVEKLIAYLPLLLAFFAAWEIAELAAAKLVTQRASSAAGRAAMVVLADDPRYYDGEPVGSYAGKRRDEIELAAAMVLSALPRLTAGFEVEVSDVGELGSSFDVTVRAPYDCGAVSLLCGGQSGTLELSATTSHAYQGAKYAYAEPGGALGGANGALVGTAFRAGTRDVDSSYRASTRSPARSSCDSADCKKCHELADEFNSVAQGMRRWDCVDTLNPGGGKHPVAQDKRNQAEKKLNEVRERAKAACTACSGKRYWSNLFDTSKRAREKNFGKCEPKCDNNINVLGRQYDILPFRDRARNRGASRKVNVFDDFQERMDKSNKGNVRQWNLDINGGWIRDRIQDDGIFFVATDTNEANMKSKNPNFVCTVTAREIQALLNAGYRPYGNWWMKPAQAQKCFPGLLPDPPPETYCGNDKSDPFHLGNQAGATGISSP